MRDSRFDQPNVHRDSKGLPRLEWFFYDLRFALRGLRRDWTFTLAAIVMLALAVGLNVTVFTIMGAMVFRGFPLVQKNDRLVYIQERFPSGACCVSYPDFEDWRSQAHAFEGMAFVAERPATFSTSDGRSIRIVPPTLSTNTFKLLGVSPLLGRDFLPTDEVAGAERVAILSYDFWKSWFGKRADVVGSTVRIEGRPATIIGVMPEGFNFPVQKDLWMPLDHTPQLQQRGSVISPFQGSGGYLAFGRLRDGVDLKEARAELETINRRLEAAYPATNYGVIPTAQTHSQIFVGPDALAIYGSLWAGGWFILFIACANLGILTLARTIGRLREFSTKIALGAAPRRMISQILVESVTLATIAGVLGYWITNWGVSRWAAATASPYQILDYTVDSGTVSYLIAISFAAAILFSLGPIGRILRYDVNAALQGGRGITRDLRGKRLAAVLVVGQMALAIVLLSGAGILVRSLLKVVSAETGVRDPENILVGSMRLPTDKYPTPETRLGYFDRLKAQLKSIPGVASLAVSSALPVDSGNLRLFEIEGKASTADTGQSAQFLSVGPDYFRVVEAPPIVGRDFNDADDAGTLPVAIVNQSLAARFWPDEQPLGKRLRVKDGKWRVVVGVVPNIMQGDGTRQTFKPLVYVPFPQELPPRAFFLARTGVPPDQVAQTVRAELVKLDPGVTLQDFATLKATFAFRADRMDREHSEMGKNAAVAPIFAVIALLLAVIGLYAVVAHSMNQRGKEIGVRMAIGAAPEEIRRMVLRDGMLPVAIGLILGLAASFGVNRILQSQLVGLSPYDPVTMAGSLVILISVALLACLIPARRAMGVDPTVALRG